MSFKDHFSARSADYAAYRPTYPDTLVDYLAGLCAATDVALDAGCGTGQLSWLLARRFQRVIATDATIQHFYKHVMGPYWPPERRYVEEGYRSFAFPFDEWTAPPLAIEVQWKASDLIGYADTWSAVRGAEKALGRAPIETFRRDLMQAWGDPERRRTIRFPLSLRVGRM